MTLTVTVTDSEGAVSASAAADCSGNSRPTVALVRPEKLVYGQPTTFTATGTIDGDELTYEWKIGDDVVKGQTGATAELTVAKGDRVTVNKHRFQGCDVHRRHLHVRRRLHPDGDDDPPRSRCGASPPSSRRSARMTTATP